MTDNFATGPLNIGQAAADLNDSRTEAPASTLSATQSKTA